MKLFISVLLLLGLSGPMSAQVPSVFEGGPGPVVSVQLFKELWAAHKKVIVEKSDDVSDTERLYAFYFGGYLVGTLDDMAFWGKALISLKTPFISGSLKSVLEYLKSHPDIEEAGKIVGEYMEGLGEQESSMASYPGSFYIFTALAIHIAKLEKPAEEQ